jgi:hypothetical protein
METTATRRDARDEIEAIRRTHRIAEVVAHSGVELRRVGRALVGRCPFYPDGERPNLHVYEDTENGAAEGDRRRAGARGGAAGPEPRRRGARERPRRGRPGAAHRVTAEAAQGAGVHAGRGRPLRRPVPNGPSAGRGRWGRRPRRLAQRRRLLPQPGPPGWLRPLPPEGGALRLLPGVRPRDDERSARDYRAKFAAYAAYRASGRFERDYDGFPTILVVTTDNAAEERIAHAARQTADGRG